MLPFWKESPFIRILMPFLMGIFLFYLFPASALTWPASACICILVFLILFSRNRDYIKFRFAWVKGVLIFLFLTSSGYLLCVLHTPPASTLWYRHQSTAYNYALVRIQSEPEKKAKSLKAVVEVIQLVNNEKRIPVSGSALVYFEQGAKVKALKQGDQLLIKNKFKAIVSSGNPGAFDYAAWCRSKKIYESAFLRGNEWEFTGIHTADASSFFAGANAWTRNILKKYLPDSNTHGIAEALLLGYRADLDPETWQAYSNTGIVHIIAISGMHMAMIYASTRYLLLLIPFFKKNKKTALLLSLLFMWLFACITGLPASVTRAAVMFTFIGLGEMQDRKMNILNNLAASAFCILCWNPMLLSDTGFQLSYAAVLSLVLFYTPVYNWFYFSGKVADLGWRLVAATLAAQVLTFPLCIYYFHQFPLLFLVTNFFAVPITTGILYLEIVLVLIHFLNPVARFTGMLISNLVSIVNKSVKFLSDLSSYTVWSEINISAFQMILLFLGVGLITLWIYYKKTYYLLVFLFITLIYSMTVTLQSVQTLQQKRIIVYNIKGQRSLEFIYRHQYECPDADSILKNKNNETYVLKPAHIFFNVFKSREPLSQKITRGPIGFYFFAGKTILRLQHTRFDPEIPLVTDLLVLSSNCMPDAEWLSAHVKTAMIVVDSSVPSWKIAKLKENLKSLTIPVYFVEEQGAFILDV